MAFSRSEDRTMRPVSLSSSLSTPPTSPSSTYPSPRAEVDADGVERWLTSPSRRATGPTDDLATKTTNPKNPSPRLRLADVTARRRQQQLQEQNQPLPQRSASPRVSLRHSKLMREWQEKEQRQLSQRSNLVPPSMSSSQRRELFRRTARTTIAAIEKQSFGKSSVIETDREHQNKILSDSDRFTQQFEEGNDTTTPVVVSNEAKESEKNSDVDNGFKVIQRASPGIAAIRLRRQQRREREGSEKKEKGSEKEGHGGQEKRTLESTKTTENTPEKGKNGTTVQPSLPSQSLELASKMPSDVVASSPQTDNIEKKEAVNLDTTAKPEEGGKSNTNDERVFSVSRTKKIHLLKRHDAGKGGSPLVREVISNDSSNSVPNDATQVTIHSNENSVSTIARLRMIRRQMADGNHRRTQEHSDELEHPQERRSLLAAADESLIARQKGQERESLNQLKSNPRGAVANDDEQDQSTETALDSDVDNTNSTMRIKDALARAKSYRRSMNKRNNHGEIGYDVPKCGGGESYGGMALKHHFRSSTIPCASVMSAGTSTISVESVDDESSVSRTISDDEDSDEGVSQLTIPTELESTVSLHRGVGQRLLAEEAKSKSVDHEKSDSVVSSGEKENDSEQIRRQSSTDSSFDEYMDELVMAVEGDENVTAEEDMQIQLHASRVKLHVYDLVADDTQLDLWGIHFPLGQVFNAVNSSLHSIGTGAYHVGLEINGIEYAYGANTTKGLTGIFTCAPKCSPGYQFRTTIDFGDRVVMKRLNETKPGLKVAVDGQEIVREMANEYLGTDYDLLRKNCCSFAHDVCIRLGINEDEIPSWFHNLAEAGAITQDAATYTLAPITQLFNGKELDKFADYLNNTALDDKLEAIQDGVVEDKREHECIADKGYQY